ncbi:MAG TPA: hypothetical protein PKC24_06055 [Cyclobacteriaceae bacterium]|nr:hypothetical protein [Cyclobacteriaceae bacterium]
MKTTCFVISLFLCVSMAFAQVPTHKDLIGKWNINLERTVSALSGEMKEMLSDKNSDAYKVLSTHWLKFENDGKLIWAAEGMPNLSGTWTLSSNILKIKLAVSPDAQIDLSYMVAYGANSLALNKIEAPADFLSVSWFIKEE